MGREIIHQMAPYHPGKRSRLWHREDIMDGTEVVEGIVLDAQASQDVICTNDVFAQIQWRTNSLVVLDMQHSNIRELWKEETKCLNNLKVIDLSNSRFFAKTPNFSGLPSLERLILENCTSLADIHQSVGELKKLVFLNLKGCGRLQKLPESIFHLKSLETMNLEGCLGLEKLPEQLGNMKVLTDLLLDGAGVKHLPYSTGILKKLKRLLVPGIRFPVFVIQQSLSYSEEEELVIKQEEELVIEQQPFLPPSLSGLSSLTTLDISNRYLSNNGISINLGSLSSLQDLNLAGNDFSELPAGIGHLAKLEKLDLSDCPNILFISEIPSSLRALVARDCTSMEKVSIQSETAPDLLRGCGKLAEIQGLESVENKPVIRMENCNNLSNNFKEILLQVLSKGKLPDVVLPGSDLPHWFMQYQRDRSSSTFRIPPISAGLSRGLIVWTVYAAIEVARWTGPIQGAIEGGDELEVSVKPGDNTIPKKGTSNFKLREYNLVPDQLENSSVSDELG
ncbi:disease resistance protein RPS4-like [Populus alba]|uniref:disease resistance protein RPS4-like n=1 Tax=Populus alba TaxID=43335 RepID=UPI003CC6E376